MRVTVARLHALGKYLAVQQAARRVVRWGLRIWHLLKIIILRLSSGHGELLAFIEATTLEISWKVGGSMGKEEE